MRRSLVVPVVAVAVLVVSTSALAKQKYLTQVKAEYPEAKASCATCHVKPLPTQKDRVLNPFGTEVKAKAFAKDATTGKKVLDLKKVEGLDSDGDGKGNAEELKAGTNPGDAASK